MRLSVLVLCLLTMTFNTARAQDLQYPPTPRVDVVDDYHGVSVPDPYRWLENITAPEVKDWVGQQNALTQAYLGNIPGRDRLLTHMKSMLAYERWSTPAEAGGRYFFSRNDGLQNFSVVQVSASLDFDAGRTLLDPNQWSTDGSVSLAGYAINEAGTRILYAKSGSGSDWTELFIKDVASGQDLADRIQWAKFAGFAWADAAGTAFYYLRFPEPTGDSTYTGQNLNPQIWHHVVGTEQSADTLVFALPEHPDWWMSAGVSEDYTLLQYYVSTPGSTHNRLFFQRLDQPGSPVLKTFDALDASYSLVHNEGDRLWIQTDKDAPNGRIIEVSLSDPDPAKWKTIVPEQPFALSGVTTAGGYFFLHYLKDARTVVEKYRPDGTHVARVALPGAGTASGFGGRRDQRYTYFQYMDFVTPAQNFRYDTQTDTVEPLPTPQFPVDTSRYESRLLFCRSYDGTAIPLFVTHRKGIALDGTRPTLLYAYGGFGGTQQPYFSSSRLAWLDCGGVLAVAGIRGGAEYGEAWHQATIKTRRQVSFNDLIAAGEYLIDSGYTSPARLALNGGSQGGFLVSAVALQRPDLFAVSLPQVPVADMLRFNQFTAGKGWERDYGSPQNPDEFAVLHAVSPYHMALRGGCYPAMLVTTADTDDRVVPSHSFKLAAALQAGQSCAKPVLLRVETAAGHGAGKPLDKQLEEIADIYAFALENMGLAIPENF
jgi:prolyl oligopeptidase